MLVNHVLGPLVLVRTLLGSSTVSAGPDAYNEAIARALRLLPRQPDKIVVVDRDGKRSRAPIVGSLGSL